MFHFEEKMADVVLSGFAPEGNEGLAPRKEEVDYIGGIRRFIAGSDTKARLGIRLALWIMWSAPLWTFLRAGSMASMEPVARSELLDRLLVHRFFVVRELCLLLKLIACMCFLGVDAVRARTSYDHPETPALVRLAAEGGA